MSSIDFIIRTRKESSELRQGIFEFQGFERVFLFFQEQLIKEGSIGISVASRDGSYSAFSFNQALMFGDRRHETVRFHACLIVLDKPL